MSDHFEKAKDDILLRTDGNGGPTNRDMLKAMGALALDVDEAMDELDERQKKRHIESVVAMKEHVLTAVRRDEQIRDLQGWREKSSASCVERMTKIAETVTRELHGSVHEQHMAEFHGKPRRMDDPPDSEFTETRESAFPGSAEDDRSVRELLMGWSLFKKLTWLIVSTVVAGILLFGISYYGSLWATDRAEQAFVHTEETMLPQPAVTVTVTPSATP